MTSHPNAFLGLLKTVLDALDGSYLCPSFYHLETAIIKKKGQISDCFGKSEGMTQKATLLPTAKIRRPNLIFSNAALVFVRSRVGG